MSGKGKPKAGNEATQPRSPAEGSGVARLPNPHPNRRGGLGRRNEIDRRVFAVVARVMNTEPEDLTPEIRFVEDLRADSLRVMELVLELEEEFDIKIPDSALERIRSVGDAIEFVRARLADG